MKERKSSLLIISFSNISTDARVLKQVSLFRDKYELFTCGQGPAPDGVAGHFEVPADLAIWRYDRRLLIARQFRRAYWTNAAVLAAKNLLDGHTFDAVLANDADAVGLGLSISPRWGLHADLHEYAPRQKEELLRWKLFVAPFMTWMCRAFIPKATSVTTVGQGIANEYHRVFGVDVDVVTNAAPFSELQPSSVHEPISLVHSGACLRDRGISGIIEAVEACATPLTLDLYLTPNDPAHLAELHNQVSTSAQITIHDPVPYSELTETLNQFDVGVHVLPPVSFNNAWALPNKFFDYVQARLGLLIGPSPEMASLLREHKLGAVTNDFSPRALALVLDGLTPQIVNAWKQASNDSALALSSQVQVGGWDRAISALMHQED